MTHLDRKKFLQSVTLAGAGMSLTGSRFLGDRKQQDQPVRIGVIGLDISHSTAFTRSIKNPEGRPELSGFDVVAAYPYGSRTIESSYSRIPEYTEEMKEMGVDIVDSVDELLSRSDVVFLLTNDGHMRREQAMKVLDAGKMMFMDKPVGASLADVIAIMDASERLDVPVFSSSSLRFITHAHAIRHENLIGDVLGVDAYSPSVTEETHPDLFWYGIHGVETLYSVLGTGCKTVARTKTDKTDVVVGTWEEERTGVFRGLREGSREGGGIAYGSDEGPPPEDITTVDAYGGIVYGSNAILPLGPYEGYEPLVIEILEFFRTGVPPVSRQEMIEVYAFMEAADESVRQGGAAVQMEDVIAEARRQL
ncbi:MAG: Gfo/Idh/MocA family oxidoreductase [Balneolaceae bacterium]